MSATSVQWLALDNGYDTTTTVDMIRIDSPTWVFIIVISISVSHSSLLSPLQSQNFFAALDDSGDEAPAPVKINAKKREPKSVNKKPDADAPATTGKSAVEPSKQNQEIR
jgi:hypothetical protein